MYQTHPHTDSPSFLKSTSSDTPVAALVSSRGSPTPTSTPNPHPACPSRLVDKSPLCQEFGALCQLRGPLRFPLCQCYSSEGNSILAAGSQGRPQNRIIQQSSPKRFIGKDTEGGCFRSSEKQQGTELETGLYRVSWERRFPGEISRVVRFQGKLEDWWVW